MAKRPDLVVMTGELSGRHFVVGETALRLGRSSSNDIHPADEELSRNHCLFEIVGESGLKITDLASANGTYVNGELLGAESRELKEGDEIEVGNTRIKVGEPTKVDLGLSAPAENEEKASEDAKKRPAALGLLWLVAILVAAVAIGVILLTPAPTAEVVQNVRVEEPTIREVSYEKVRADSNGIFRFALSAVAGGRLSVKIDDTTNNRHAEPKAKELTEDGLEELGRILEYRAVSALDPEYSGLGRDASELESYVLKVVYTTGIKKIAVINTQEPDEFAVIRGKLEAFSKSELGVWAIAYSRDRLIELAEEAVRLGDTKWDDRDVNHGNLAAAIVAYREAEFYLETVEPKPECAIKAKDGLTRATTELDKRYTDQRFLADRALNLAQWETARDELKILLEMVPDRKDARNRDASQKLVSAENNLNKKGGR